MWWGTSASGLTIIPNNKNFRPRKLAYQEKLGYDYRIFFFSSSGITSYNISQYFDYVDISTMKLPYLRTQNFK